MIQTILNLLFPPRCPWCARLGAVAPDKIVCATCHADLHWSTGPWRSNKLPIQSCDQIHAVFEFRGQVRETIHKLKYERQPQLARSCAALMQATAHATFSPNVVLAVPLSLKRLRARRYNQAQCLAQHIATALHWPLLTGAVTRAHLAKHQIESTLSERWENVQGQFAVRAESVAEIQNQDILLIDDVITTGATLTSLAQTLKKAGARTVSALTLAQTL